MLLYNDDCLEILRTLEDNSIDSLVTDPPAGIAFMNKEWDRDKGGRDQWVCWLAEIMKEAYRVLKPGAHGLVWSFPRTSHWAALALDSAGFEIRDTVTHIFGSGFPKSLNIAKAIDSRLCVEVKREVGLNFESPVGTLLSASKQKITHDLRHKEAKDWEGWGTGLKPAHEVWWLVRKKIDCKTIAENVLKHGTGGINIDGCRVAPLDEKDDMSLCRKDHLNNGKSWANAAEVKTSNYKQGMGRFPANLIHDGSDEVVGLFPFSKSSGGILNKKESKNLAMMGKNYARKSFSPKDEGSNAIFFYCAKTNPSDRGEGLEDFSLANNMRVNAPRSLEGEEFPTLSKNTHQTVKNTNLMRYLCRLITPAGGVSFRPFYG